LLYKQETIDGKQVSLPIVVAPDGSVTNTDTESASASGGATGWRVSGATLREIKPRNAAGSIARLIRNREPPAGSLAEVAGGVPLDIALTTSQAIRLLTRVPSKVLVDDLRPLLDGEPLPYGGDQYYPMLDRDGMDALMAGLTVNVH